MAIAKKGCGAGKGNQHQDAVGDRHGAHGVGHGPATNAGTGESEGSGFEDQGAPNSGDGISDGSGWDAENTPSNTDGESNGK